MKVILIRHGHAEHNLAFDIAKDNSVYRNNLYYNSSLTEKGITQCIDASINESTKTSHVNKVYCSPLRRCIQTGHIIFGDNRLLFLEDDLIETKGPYPCNHRLPLEDIVCEYENIVINNLDPHYVNSEKDEGIKALKMRANTSFERICKGAKSENLESIAIVTHHDWIEALTGKSISNASFVELEYN
jgi:broad specificity phosphatase PhoE